MQEGQQVLENRWTFWFDNTGAPSNSSLCEGISVNQDFEQSVTELGVLISNFSFAGCSGRCMGSETFCRGAFRAWTTQTGPNTGQKARATGQYAGMKLMLSDVSCRRSRQGFLPMQALWDFLEKTNAIGCGTRFHVQCAVLRARGGYFFELPDLQQEASFYGVVVSLCSATQMASCTKESLRWTRRRWAARTCMLMGQALAAGTEDRLDAKLLDAAADFRHFMETYKVNNNVSDNSEKFATFSNHHWQPLVTIGDGWQ